MTDEQNAPNRIPTGVGRTALLTAYARAQESERPDRLFTDPWAELLVDTARERDDPNPALSPGGPSAMRSIFAAYFAGRTPFFDQQVLAGVAAGARQLVLLAAGLDARSTRLELPADFPVYEVDSAPVLRFKAETLANAGLDVPRRIPVAADLAGDWTEKLDAAGFRPELPTVWLAEGLFMYLDDQTCRRLFGTVLGHCAPGSRMAIEYFSRTPRESDLSDWTAAEQHILVNTVTSMFTGGPAGTPRQWLPQFDVTIDKVTDVATEIARQGRQVPAAIDPDMEDPVTVWLAAATW